MSSVCHGHHNNHSIEQKEREMVDCARLFLMKILNVPCISMYIFSEFVERILSKVKQTQGYSARGTG